MKKYLCLLACLLGLIHCVSTDPHKDFVIARTALERAKKFQADKLYPKIYTRALRLYKKALSSYNQKDYGEAQTHFQEVIKWAEKAELKARLKQAKEESL